MDTVLDEFRRDVDKVRRILVLTEKLTGFGSQQFDESVIAQEPLKGTVVGLLTSIQESHAEMPILNGVLLLYLAGRFENYVRDTLEDLSDAIAVRCELFVHLPRAMQKNLVRYTAQVLASPRDYGHGENGVLTFVNTLADNLNGRPLTAVNSKCLSITEGNMWPDTLADVFTRIGAVRVWERLGEQAAIQAFFNAEQTVKATSEARKCLENLMTLRNQIAHPSGALAWPSPDQVSHFVDFCDVIAQALSEICEMWSTTLGTSPQGSETAILPPPT